MQQHAMKSNFIAKIYMCASHGIFLRDCAKKGGDESERIF